MKQYKYYNYQKKYRKTIKGHLIYCFHNIIARCNNSKHKSYKNYGGRGIKCLFKSFDEFIDYVVNELQVDPRGLTIDRIDNDGYYERGNIRFITQAENNRNRIFNPETHCCPDNSGEKHGNAKLTEQDVKLIRKLYNSKVLNQPQLVNKFNIDQSQISRIINRKVWKHI